VQQWSIGNYRYLTPLRQHCTADRSVAENYLCHFSRFSRSHLLPAAVFTAALVRIMSGGIYRHFSRYYLLPAAVFTAALASCFRKSWIRTVLHARPCTTKCGGRAHPMPTPKASKKGFYGIAFGGLRYEIYLVQPHWQVSKQ